MDSSTLQFYAGHATSLAAKYESANVQSLHRILKGLVTRDTHVLDVGAGSGREAAFLAQLGCKVTYTDGCSEMLAQGVRIHPELEESSRVAVFPLPNEDVLLAERFDLVVCVAVIMHLTDAMLERLASQLASVCVPSGHLVLSHSHGRRGLVRERDRDGTLFRERPAEEVSRLFATKGLETVSETRHSDGLCRGDICWVTQVLYRAT